MPLAQSFLNPNEVLRQLDIREGMLIGDFGAGSGHFAIALSKRSGNYGKVFAVDIREASLEAVKSRARSENAPNIITSRANLEVIGSTGIADNSLDLVVLITVLSQSNKKDKILEESLRVLKREGMLLVVEWAQTGSAFSSSHEYRIAKEDLQKIAQDVGFKMSKEISVGSFHYGLVLVRP